MREERIKRRREGGMQREREGERETERERERERERGRDGRQAGRQAVKAGRMLCACCVHVVRTF